ncbi:hypothetical protein DCAR_0312073 [Daucus carota subsp. sativus]|uniref:Polymerase nucleotidyl transferase domain-containing protein n=2 Tax=Daucus carota subsp. sativus TaxID=79200 RepID=A0A169WA90_DAUCS|nr:hypothetical protein DCAR_0312073 [Daucus carota subsp. sativus]
MGSHEGLSQPDVFYPNGLLPEEASSVTRVLDLERWSIAEERIAELIGNIQPNKPSEDKRNAVANYVQQLITKCFSCQVFTFGSVPLKTYLPDGDIDLTAFSKNLDLKDSWATEVRDMLQNEEKNDNAEFCVKEVQYIQAEVKLIKCLVENIVVDISFNQLGGLCTLCFLEEVDSLINQNHLFKRSIILIKAWCYYESRILGAHHGLISTYALETLVLYIFHVYNSNFTGPLEVLYRFLEFFSKFDWEHYCVSLWGPVPIVSLPEVIADPPRKDGGDLLLNKVFLRACSTVYSVFPGGQENNELPFIPKHFNVIDPLRANNNLGRSVSKGNFFRIRSAFAFGAEKLARMLDCPRENVIAEVNQFFLNTWDRHGKGHRPDALGSGLRSLRPLNLNQVNGSSDVTYPLNSKKIQSAGREVKLQKSSHLSNGILQQKGNQPFKTNSRTINNTAALQSQKTSANSTCSVVSNQNHHTPPEDDGKHNAHIDNGRNKLDQMGNKMNLRYQYERTNSTAERMGRENESLHRSRHNRTSETVREQAAASRLDYGRKNSSHESSTDNDARSNTAFSSNTAPNRLPSHSASNARQEDGNSAPETLQMHQEEQDLVNMMASSRVHSLEGHYQMPMKFASSHLPVPFSPSYLASMGYPNRIPSGMGPNGFNPYEMPWALHAHYSQGLVSMPQFTPNVRTAAHHQEEIVEPNEDYLTYRDIHNDDVDHGQWSEQNENSVQGCDPDDESLQVQQSENKKPLFSGGSTVVNAPHLPSRENYLVDGHGSIYEDRSSMENIVDNHRHHRRSEVYSSSQGSLPAARTTSSRSKLSSEGSCDGSSLKSSRSVREIRERVDRKSVQPVEHSQIYKNGLQHENDSVDFPSPRAADDSRDWIPLSTVDSEVVEDTGHRNVAPFLRLHQIPSYGTAQLSGPNSLGSVAPIPVVNESWQRTSDDHGSLPFAFYPAGPPVPFVTMLPFYGFPSETEASDGSANHFERDEDFDPSHINQSGQRTTESVDHIQNSGQLNKKWAPSEELSPEKSDFLNGDFISHWHNLQYGRSCQSPDQEPVLCPPPVVPPMYVQGHMPSDGPGRPLSANASLFTQLMGYGPGTVHVSPLQPGPNRHGGAYQASGDEIPRYRGGTGTYLPNMKLQLDRQSSKARNSKGNYGNDRKNHNADRDPNWGLDSKLQYAGRGQSRNQAEMSNTRIDRHVPNNSRPDKKLYTVNPYSMRSNHLQNGPISSSKSFVQASSNVPYGMYPVPVMNPNGAAPSGNNVPSVVMFYPYDQNMGGDSPAERQLKFGSIAPMHFSNLKDAAQLGRSSSNDDRQQRNFSVGSGHSSPDLPSSPMHHR